MSNQRASEVVLLNNPNYRINQTELWEEMGSIGEQKVIDAIPKDFISFRNRIIPCQHGYDYEELDLLLLGSSGI